MQKDRYIGNDDDHDIDDDGDDKEALGKKKWKKCKWSKKKIRPQSQPEMNGNDKKFFILFVFAFFK